MLKTKKKRPRVFPNLGGGRRREEKRRATAINCRCLELQLSFLPLLPSTKRRRRGKEKGRLCGDLSLGVLFFFLTVVGNPFPPLLSPPTTQVFLPDLLLQDSFYFRFTATSKPAFTNFPRKTRFFVLSPPFSLFFSGSKSWG